MTWPPRITVGLGSTPSFASVGSAVDSVATLADTGGAAEPSGFSELGRRTAALGKHPTTKTAKAAGRATGYRARMVLCITRVAFDHPRCHRYVAQHPSSDGAVDGVELSGLGTWNDAVATPTMRGSAGGLPPTASTFIIANTGKLCAVHSMVGRDSPSRPTRGRPASVTEARGHVEVIQQPLGHVSFTC